MLNKSIVNNFLTLEAFNQYTILNLKYISKKLKKKNGIYWLFLIKFS